MTFLSKNRLLVARTHCRLSAGMVRDGDVMARRGKITKLLLVIFLVFLLLRTYLEDELEKARTKTVLRNVSQTLRVLCGSYIGEWKSSMYVCVCLCVSVCVHIFLHGGNYL